MANEYSAVPCNEVKGTDSESWDLEGNQTAQVTLKVSGALKDALVADLLNNKRPWPNTSIPNPPRAHRITSVKGFSTDASMTSSQQNYVWESYELVVNYTTANTQDLYAETIEPIVDFVRMDHRFFRWSTGEPLSEGEAPGQLRPWFALKKQVFQAPSVPSELLLYPGYVHNANYYSPWWGRTFPAETLLLKPEPIDRKVTTAGSPGYNWTVNFMYNPNGWNKFYRPTTGTWAEIIRPDGSTWKNYPLANLSGLLT